MSTHKGMSGREDSERGAKLKALFASQRGRYQDSSDKSQAGKQGQQKQKQQQQTGCDTITLDELDCDMEYVKATPVLKNRKLVRRASDCGALRNKQLRKGII